MLLYSLPAAPPAPPAFATFPVMRFPLDHSGTPMPHSPQLLTIQGLQAQATKLSAVLATSRASGADEAAISAAEAALKEGAAAAASSLASEKDRVTTARIERAKLEKKRKRSTAVKK